MMRTIRIRPLTDSFGLEITGLNLAKAIDNRLKQMLLCCFQQYQLLVFRHQQLSEADYIAMGKLFGRLAISRAPMKIKDHPQISVISNIKTKGIIVPEYWHSDGHYAVKAYRGIIWHCIVAPRKGGETLFTNLRLAYDTLPKALKQRVRHKHIWYENVDDPRMPVPHPMVIYNSKVHSKALYVMMSNAIRVDDLDPKASKVLIKKLETHATNPAFIYTHRWQKDDVVLCDNLSLLHSATIPPKSPRLLHRLHFY
jgi:taurine dioxygenase